MKKQLICCLSLALVIAACRNEQPQTDREQTQSKSEQSKDEKAQNKEDNQADNDSPTEGKGTTNSEDDEAQSDPKEQDESPQEQAKQHDISDLDLGRQAQVEWRVAETDYLAGLDFEALYVSGDPEAFSFDRLRPYVRVYSSDPQRNQYHTLDDEELDYVQIKDLRYEDRGRGYLTFLTSYKGYTSHTRHSLPFDRFGYYAQRIRVRPEAVSGWYMRGVAQHLRLFYAEALDYDPERYIVDLDDTSTQYSDSDNSISFDVYIEHRATGRSLAKIPLTLSGFKPLSSLKNDLIISSQYELVESMRNRLKRYKAEDDLRQWLGRSLPNWIRETSVSISKGNGISRLIWDNITVSGGSVSALVPESNQKKHLDLMLEAPRFSLLEARLVDHNLVLRLSLDFVNDQALEDITLPLVIHNVISD